VRVLPRGQHTLRSHPLLTRNALDWIGIGRTDAAALVCLAVAAAFTLSLSRRSRSGVTTVA